MNLFPGHVNFLYLLLLLCSFSGVEKMEVEKPAINEPPNIIFIFIDDLGYGDLSIYGNEKIETPNIDAIAREGIRFTGFYSNAPVCSPSRVAAITGSYPFKFGIYGVIASQKKNLEREQANFLDTLAPLLPRILQKQGYRTGHFGKWHMGGGRDISDVPYPEDYGFDRSLVGFEGIGDRILDKEHELSDMSAALGKGKIFRTDKNRITQIYVDSALAFVRENREAPFYINLFPGDVHDPFKPAEDSIVKYRKFARDREEAKFFAVLKETDRQVGRFLDSLDRMGAMDNTIVVLSSDNGPTDWPRYYKNNGQPPSSQGNLRGRKWSLYEGGIRVPLIVQWKGKVPKNAVDTTTCGMVMDLFPSLLSMAGLENPRKEDIDGKDLREAIFGTPIKNDRPLFWYFPNIPKPGNPEYLSPEFAMRQGEWKLLMEEGSEGLELYNLEWDPQEQQDLSKRLPEKANSLKKILAGWREQYVTSSKRQVRANRKHSLKESSH